MQCSAQRATTSRSWVRMIQIPCPPFKHSGTGGGLSRAWQKEPRCERLNVSNGGRDRPRKKSEAMIASPDARCDLSPRPKARGVVAVPKTLLEAQGAAVASTRGPPTTSSEGICGENSSRTFSRASVRRYTQWKTSVISFCTSAHGQ